VVVTEDAQQQAAVEDLIKILREYAASHVAWFRVIKVVTAVPADTSLVLAGGSSAPLPTLQPATLVVGHSACLPGWDVKGDGKVFLAPPAVDNDELASLESRDDDLRLDALQRYLPGMSVADVLARIGRLSKSIGVDKGPLRLPAKDVARWLRSPARCS